MDDRKATLAHLIESIESAFDFDAELDRFPDDDKESRPTVDAFLEFAEAEPASYTIPNILVARNLADLYNPSTTDAQWTLGRVLAQQLSRSIQLQGGLSARPNETADRVFICIYIEWCIVVHEMGESQARQRAATLFDIPLKRLDDWYTRQKGDKWAERATARLLIGLMEQISELDPIEIQKIFPDSVINNPPK